VAKRHNYDGFNLDLFDPEYTKKVTEPFLKLTKLYFRYSLEGLEHIPEGPVLIVGNHNGGSFPIDPFIFFLTWNQHFHYHRPLRALGHDMLFRLALSGKFLCKTGAVRANPGVAEKILLERQESVAVFPGGSEEAFRKFSRRHQIDFHNRKGFVRLALKTGVPVVPVVFSGGHETCIVLSEGKKLAHLLEIKRFLRLKTFPIVFSMPYGFTSGYFPYIPFPAKMDIRVLKPITFPEYGAKDIENEEVLQKCYDIIYARMQRTLHEMADERRFPILG
jgi:1-acyl-sn-glycerol-3-phosphate acyltransferase